MYGGGCFSGRPCPTFFLAYRRRSSLPIRRTFTTTTTTPSSTTRIVCCVGYATNRAFAWVALLVGMIVFHGYVYSSTSWHNSKNKYAAHDASPESFQRSLARAVQKEPSQTVLRSGHAEVNDVTNEPLLPQPCYSSSIAIAPTIYKTRSPISCATYLTNDPLVVPSLYPKMETMNRWPMGSHPFKNNFLPPFHCYAINIHPKSRIRTGPSHNTMDGLCNVYSLLVRSNAKKTCISLRISCLFPSHGSDSRQLLAVSDFHDSGFTGRVLDSTRAVRSGVIGAEKPVQRKERHVLLCPEISHTFHF